MISFVIPSYNNLRHLKNVYNSVKKHAPDAEIVLLDDGSTDGTFEWISSLADRRVIAYKCTQRVGHTILYDKGIELATNEVVGILHADMIIGPNYVNNLIKHLKPGKVVCATRVEPPLHPAGKEKIIQDFGLDFDTLNIPAFESFCEKAQQEFKDQTTAGMFAPWVLYKKDFQAMQGHDPLFAPFPYEDSDIFQRWIMAGYELVQSRDAFVYHLTCRGHRWTDQVGVDDDYYKQATEKASKNYLRKWGSWIKNDEYQYPIIPRKYDIGYVMSNSNLALLSIVEPWCSTVYIQNYNKDYGEYVSREQQRTSFNLSNRIKPYDNGKPNDILVEFDGSKLTQESFNILTQLPEIIAQSGEVGDFELDIFKVSIYSTETYEHKLVKLDDPYYTNQLLN